MKGDDNDLEIARDNIRHQSGIEKRELFNDPAIQICQKNIIESFHDYRRSLNQLFGWRSMKCLICGELRSRCSHGKADL